MPETTEIQGFDATAMIIVAVLLAIFGIVVGFQLGTSVAKNTKTKKEYVQKCAIAYGFAILFTAVVCMTGYIVLNVFMFGAIGGLIAGLTMEYGKMEGPFKAAHNFVGKKERKLQEPQNPQAPQNPKDSQDPQGPQNTKIPQDTQDPQNTKIPQNPQNPTKTHDKKKEETS